MGLVSDIDEIKYAMIDDLKHVNYGKVMRQIVLHRTHYVARFFKQ